MKKFRFSLVTLLAAALFALAGCSSDEPAGNSTDSQAAENTAQATERDSETTNKSVIASDNEEAEKDTFYPDLLTEGAVAEKELLAEKQFNETKQDNDVEISLNGIQYTELTPAEEYSDSFTGFKDAGKIVAATVYLTITNNTDQAFPLDNIGAFLETSNYRILNHNVLESDDGDAETEASSDKYLVFLMDEADYDKQDAFELRITSITNGEEDLLANDIAFEVPKE